MVQVELQEGVGLHEDGGGVGRHLAVGVDPRADVVGDVAQFAPEGVVNAVEVDRWLQVFGDGLEQFVDEIRQGLGFGAVADGHDLSVVADVHGAEEVVEEGVGCGEDDVAEPVLFRENEDGVEEDFE